eukprot:UN12865
MKDQNAPARNKSSYILFCNDRREQARSDNPEASMVEISKILGALWSESTDKEKLHSLKKRKKVKQIR